MTTCEGRGRRATPRQRTGTTFSKYASEPRVGSSNIIAYTFKKLQSYNKSKFLFKLFQNNFEFEIKYLTFWMYTCTLYSSVHPLLRQFKHYLRDKDTNFSCLDDHAKV